MEGFPLERVISMNILFLGDVVGKLGRKVIEEQLPELRKEFNINVVIVNGENVAHGKGITQKTYKWLMEQGVACVTMGNHTWDNKDIFEFIDEKNNIVVPANYPKGTPGKGYHTFNYNGTKITVISLMGTVFMNGRYDCPFETVDHILDTVESDVYFVDVHGETTSEKMALGYHLDGRVAAVLGTHTHVATADARILEQGTAYQTDVGMNGAYDGVIGVQKECIIRRFRTGMPERFIPVDTGKMQLNGVVIEVKNGKASKITQINRVFTP